MISLKIFLIKIEIEKRRKKKKRKGKMPRTTIAQCRGRGL